MIRTLVCAALFTAVNATVAHAQITITGGLAWSGGYDLGGSSAQLRTNATGTAPPQFTLFNVDSRLAPAPGAEARVGFALTPRLSVEGGVVFARRRLSFRISGDPESGNQEFDGESLQHFVFDGALLWELPLRRDRVRTFALAGAGYLRQLHQDRTLVESGQTFSLGGGARYWLRGRPESNRSLGLRADVRVNLRRHGIDFDNAARVYPTLSLVMFLAL